MKLKTIYEDIELGEPWKLFDKAMGIAIPILIKEESDRNYATFEEVKDKVDLIDTGNISKAKIKNNHNEHVFFRKGTMLKGGTQSRALVASIVVAPNAICMPEIKCVYASKGIRGGAKYAYAGYTPRTVTASLHTGQGAVWGAAINYSLDTKALYMNAARGAAAGYDETLISSSDSARLIEELSTIRDDDLVGISEKVEEFKEEIEKYLKNIPVDHIRQVGLMILNLEGVVGFELFDHPDSWNAISKCVSKDYSDILGKEMPDLFEMKMDKVKEYAILFLQKFIQAKGREVFNENNSQTYLIEGDRIVGEYTLLNDDLIHALALKTETPVKSRRTPARPIPTIQPSWTERVGSYGEIIAPVYSAGLNNTYETSEDYLTSRGGWTTMNALVGSSKSFGELEEETGVSPRTLSKGLKKGRMMGFIEKAYRPDNGKSVYRLTALGETVDIKHLAATESKK